MNTRGARYTAYRHGSSKYEHTSHVVHNLTLYRRSHAAIHRHHHEPTWGHLSGGVVPRAMSSRRKQRFKRRLLYILVLSVLLLATLAWVAWDIIRALLEL